MFEKYYDEKRRVGSQKEIPGVKVQGKNIIVMGYQKFTAVGSRLDTTSLKDKYLKLYNFFSNVPDVVEGNSFLDIGCSNGLVCLIAKECGFTQVTGIDHDPQAINVLQAVSRQSGLEVNGTVGEWNSISDEFDVVSCLALLHWIYSMTSNQGSFDVIFRKLRSICRKYLIIEWIDPKDSCIKSAGHIYYNPDIHISKYSYERFLEAGIGIFGPLELKIAVNSTRCIHVFKKAPRLIGFSSAVTLTDSGVTKLFFDNVLKKYPDLIAREAYALKQLSDTGISPYLYFEGDRRLDMSYCGRPLSASNIPDDAEQQGENIINILQAHGITHNDIRPANICVDGKTLHLIDFNWCRGGGFSDSYIHPSAGYGAGKKGEPLDDRMLMRRAIASVRKAQKSTIPL